MFCDRISIWKANSMIPFSGTMHHLSWRNGSSICSGFTPPPSYNLRSAFHEYSNWHRGFLTLRVRPSSLITRATLEVFAWSSLQQQAYYACYSNIITRMWSRSNFNFGLKKVRLKLKKSSFTLDYHNPRLRLYYPTPTYLLSFLNVLKSMQISGPPMLTSPAGTSIWAPM